MSERDDAMRSMDDALAIAHEFDGVLGFLQLEDATDEHQAVIVRAFRRDDRSIWIIVNDVGSLDELSRVLIRNDEWTKLISGDDDDDA